MADYLFQVSYTPEAWAEMIKRPQNRAEAVKTAIEKLGGKVKGFWLSFGDQDVVGVFEMPDNVNAAAFAMAVAGGGACRSVKTTPLLSLDNAADAMKKAGKCGYKPVTKK
jgi:uncharacterized protein with GYD domain